MKWAIIAAAALAGCTTQVEEMSYSQLQSYAASMVEKCQKQGVPDTQLRACAEQEMRADQARRRKQRQIGEAISAAGEGYSQASRANRPINCTSTSNLGIVRTTCY